MTRYPAFHRLGFAALLALLIGLRLLGTTGYMPAFERGAMTIITCPGADADAPLALDIAHHHHGQSKHKHGGPCPYASASSLGALGAEFGVMLGALLFGATLLPGRTFGFLGHRHRRARPPSRAPPLPA
jgi:hypothetical protein